MQFSKEEKAMWLEDWQRSGKSAWKYAKENGLNPQTFAKWKKEKPKDKARFVEVSAKAIQPVEINQAIIIEKGDVKIHIPLTLGCNELQTVINSLRGLV